MNCCPGLSEGGRPGVSDGGGGLGAASRPGWGSRKRNRDQERDLFLGTRKHKGVAGCMCQTEGSCWRAAEVPRDGARPPGFTCFH